jgi:hypothetical protein
LYSVKGGSAGDIQAKSSSSLSLPITLASIVGTTSSWCVVATLALSSHPTMTLAFRHNVLTIAHALAFPLPVLVATFVALHQTNDELTARRLYLGVATASLWTAAAVFWCRTFSVGYDLFSNPVRYGCAAVYVATAATSLSKWRRATVGNKNNLLSRLVRGCVGSFFSLLAPRTATAAATSSFDDPNDNNDSALYSAASLGLLILAVLPQMVGFPTATIPALLGKRLSRAVSGFTFLGAVATYCLKDASERSSSSDTNTNITTAANNTLRRGLFVGAVGHLGLLLAKVIGVDGGGILLPGKGLWELYPSLVKASGAATLLMVVTYSVLAFVTWPAAVVQVPATTMTKNKTASS